MGRISTFWSRESWVLVPAEPRGVWRWASHLISLGLSFLRSITKILSRMQRCFHSSVMRHTLTPVQTCAEWVRKVQHPARHINIGKLAEFWKFSFLIFFFFLKSVFIMFKERMQPGYQKQILALKRLFLGSVPTCSLQMPWLSHSASLFTLFLASTSQFSFCTRSREAHLSNTNAPSFS